jgi:membrane-bound serine protease (ClpP class)
MVLRSRRRPVVTGAEAMIGSMGVVLDDGLVADTAQGRADGLQDSQPGSLPNSALDSLLHGEPDRVGWARVHGERWRVRSTSPLAAGHAVRVTGRRGLMLTVVPASNPSQEGEHT